MRIIFLLLIISLAALDTMAQVQPDSTPIREQVALAPPYKVALGLRGFNSENELSISVVGRYFLNKQSALDLGLSDKVLGYQAYHIMLFYERFLPLFNSPNFMLYYGAGSGIIMAGGNSYGFITNTENNIASIKAGLGFIGGLELGLGKGPLAISLDYYRLFYLGLRNERGDKGILNVANFGIGLKYRVSLQ